MTAILASKRTGLFTLALLATAVATASATPATIIDSFTDPLPANPFLPASGRSVLFLGPLCDGAACPPAAVVTNPQEFFDEAVQSGLPGIVGPVRRTGLGTFFEPNPGGLGVLAIDPADGGRLSLVTPSGPGLQLGLEYGSYEQPLDLDLTADGSDRLEIEVLSAYTTQFDLFSVTVILGRFGDASAPWANFGAYMAGPGLLVIPYEDMGGRFEDLAHDVDYMHFYFVVRPHPETEFALGEIRTASTPTPVEPTSWGKLKNAYRR